MTLRLTMTELQRAVLETTATRDQAEALLEGLLRAKAECDEVRKRDGRPDLMEQIKGCTSIDEAIEDTRRMIAALDKAVKQGRERLQARGETLDAGAVLLHRGADAAPLATGRLFTSGRKA